MSCKTCRFSHTLEGMLVCRRYPPTVHIFSMTVPPDVRNPNGRVAAAQQVTLPPVADDQWCGEYALKMPPLRGAGG